MTRGIVLTNGLPGEGLVFPMALVFEESYSFVRDFKLIPINTRHAKLVEVNAREFEERSIVKRERWIEDTLIYGETISWSPVDSNRRRVEIVNEYTKAPKVFESRICNGETQLLLQGIMSKDRKVLWMLDIWPDLEIPYRLRQQSHPNVAVNAWVTLQILPNQSLKYELHSFDSPADSFQHTCAKAKWNSGNDGNLPTLYDPAERGELDQTYAPQLSHTLTGMHGIVMSNKMVLPTDTRHRDLCFHRIVVKDDEGDNFPAVGSHVKFNSEKIEFLGLYALNNVVLSTSNEKIPVTVDGQIKVTIRANEDLPGFYFSKLLGVFFDDPENVLECWLLSSYSKSTLQVSVTAGEPSEKGNPRYVITGITDAKSNKIQALREAGEIKLKDEMAVVVDFRGKLHFPRLPRTVISLTKDLIHKYPPGTVLRVSAVLERRWKLISAELDRKVAPIRCVTRKNEITYQEMILFHVQNARGCKDLPFFMKDPIFGVLHTPQAFRIRRMPEQLVYNDAWVTLNYCHPGDALLPPAKFALCPVGENPDDTAVPVAEVADSELDDAEENPEDRIEFARNRADVPPVFAAVNENELENRMKERGTSTNKLAQKLRENREFQKNPLKTIEREIKEHMGKCRTCVVQKFSDDCFFPEQLAYAVQMKPEIADVLNKNGLLPFVTLRRFIK